MNAASALRTLGQAAPKAVLAALACRARCLTVGFTRSLKRRGTAALALLPVMLLATGVPAANEVHSWRTWVSPHWRGTTCTWYAPADAGVPRPMADILTMVPGAIAGVCDFRLNKLTAYFTASPPRRTPAGACAYRLEQLFVAGDSSPSWSREPPVGWPYPRVSEEYMALSDGACRNPGDPSYVSVTGVSADLFVRAASFWRTLSSSADALDAGSIAGVKAASYYQGFRRRLLAKTAGDGRWSLFLAGVGMTQDIDGEDDGRAIELGIFDEAGPGEFWVLTLREIAGILSLVRIAWGQE